MSYHSHFESSPAPIERIVGALTYVNPLIGLIWLIIAALMKKGIRPFMQYHIFQSIFLAFTLFILSMALSVIMRIIHYIPIVNKITGTITFYLNMPIVLGFSVVGLIIFTIIVYLGIGAAMGRYSYFPWISNIIKTNIRG